MLSEFLPLADPVYIFTILIAIILLSPFLFRLFKIPDVAAFIIAGILIGPYGFKILKYDASIELLGTIGLLYIMFIAGLELDPEKLKISRRNSIVFGFSTFIIPFSLGMIISVYLLHLGFTASMLVSIMFSTHTLVAYPIARKLGINRDVSVLTAIGGTIITDTLVLIILSFITQKFSENQFAIQIIKIILFFGIYLIFIFYSFPKIARWFFKNVKRDRPVHFLFLLLMVCVSSALAKLMGLEAIIGAFVAGLALNKSIPKNSLLMSHIDFVGNILFIPIFLIGIGMLINTKVLYTGTYLWYISFILIVSATSGKWLAAFISQKILGFTPIQRNLLFGLSSSHAAATIAVILIGYKKGMIDVNIFNATMLIILASSLIASFVTEKYGKLLALKGSVDKDAKSNEKILVPISNPATMANLIELAKSFQYSSNGEPIFVLNIVNDDISTKNNLINIRQTLENNVSDFNNLNESIKVITRVDLNISSGILRAAKEYMISDIIFGWGGRNTTSQRLFGSVFDHLNNGSQTLYACNILEHFEKIDRALIILPASIEHELSFNSIINRIIRLPLKTGGSIEIYLSNLEVADQIKSLVPKKYKFKITYHSYIRPEDVPMDRNSKILNILFVLRKQSVSYNPLHNTIMQKSLLTNQESNFILIVPGFE